MISLGTPHYKIRHDFKPVFKDVDELETKQEMYDEESWKILQTWKQKSFGQNQINTEEKKIKVDSKETSLNVDSSTGH